MAEQYIKILYNPQETGPAEILSGRLARIVDSVLQSDNLWQHDIVRLTHLPGKGEGFPRIDKIIWKRYPLQTTLFYRNEIPPDHLMFLLRSLGADCFASFPDEKSNYGILRVAHLEGLDVRKLAESIGFPVIEPAADNLKDGEKTK